MYNDRRELTPQGSERPQGNGRPDSPRSYLGRENQRRQRPVEREEAGSEAVTLRLLQDLLESNREVTPLILQEIGGGRPPTYNTAKLKPNALSPEIEDWVTAIKDGNEEKPHAATPTLVQWAVSMMEPQLQSDWKGFVALLQRPKSDIDLEQLWDFVRRPNVESRRIESKLRTEISEMLQKDNETPREFYTRWSTVLRRVEGSSFLQSRAWAHDYRYKLQPKLKRYLGRMNVPRDKPLKVCQEAEWAWANWEDKQGRKRALTGDTKAATAEVSNVTTNDTRGRQDQPSNRRFNSNRSKSTRVDRGGRRQRGQQDRLGQGARARRPEASRIK